MFSLKCLLQNIHFLDAFIGAFVAIGINGFYQKVIKRICYLKLLGKFYHGNNDENIVTINHIYGSRFTIIEHKNGELQWRGSYKREAKGLLSGIFDYKYNAKDDKASWGKHNLRLMPNNKTMSVLVKPLVPSQEEQALSWHRK